MPDEIPLHKTAVGRTFFDHTMPTLVKELQKLNENVVTLTTTMKEAKIDYTRVAQEILNAPVGLKPPTTVGMSLTKESNGPVE